jgi:hypothetical protein
MEGFIVMATFLGVYMFYKMYKNDQEASMNSNTSVYVPVDVDTNADMDTIVHETRDLVLETLREMGCEYEEGTEGENDIRIFFTYQGERFMIEADNECYFINIYDLWWHHMSTYCDVDEFAAMQKTINRINAHANCTVLYTINQEAEEIGVHSKKNMLFVRQIPDLKGYLVSTLNDFFKVQRSVMSEIEKCKVTEEQQ